MRIVVIGSGNVAAYLGKMLNESGHKMSGVWSRNSRHARRLAVMLNAPVLRSLKDLPEADLVLVAIKDDSVRKVAAQLRTAALVVHTSGSRPMKDLRSASGRTGVLYPLQTFSKNRRPDISKVPFFIEASQKKDLALLRRLVTRMGAPVHICHSVQRKRIHLAAVIASNFTNHLLYQAFLVCGKKYAGTLKLLMEETIEKAFLYGPRESQTGPAIRDDQNVLSGHIHMLRRRPELRQLYLQFSRSIIKHS